MYSTYLIELGRKISHKRSERSWSQEQLAWNAGLHRTYVGRIERGEQNITVLSLCKIAIALGAQPCEFLPEIMSSESAPERM